MLVIIDHIAVITLSLMANYYIHLSFRKNFARRYLYEDALQKESSLNSKLQSIAFFDPLTNVWNRRVLDELEVNQEVFKGTLFVDIDYFKKFNDYYGHQAGDDTIKIVADIVKSTIRKDDYCIRYGGEEFLVLMRETSTEGIKKVADRILSAVREQKVNHQASPQQIVTVSIGWFI